MQINQENNSTERKKHEPKRGEQTKKLQPILHSGCEDTKPMNYGISKNLVDAIQIVVVIDLTPQSIC
jgi:hypothetical protein